MKRKLNSRGGKGRKRKLKAVDRIASKEANFIKDYNHKFSREIVNFAIKNKAGMIKLEALNKEVKKNSFLT